MVPLSRLPDYVERGGQQVWRAPYSARQVDLYGFVIGAEKGAIDALLLRDLVLPTGRALDYRCAHENVVVTFGSIGWEASLDPVDAGRGYLSEFEVSIWCLVADMNARGRLLWYLPYIFTNSEQTIATGREIFGYPKQLGYFDANYPDALGTGGGTTSVKTLSIDPFSPNSEATVREIISVTRAAGARPPNPAETIESELSLLYPGGFSVNPGHPTALHTRPSAAITPSGHPPPPAAPHRGAPWLKGILNALEGRSLTRDPSDLITDMVANPTLVFLKQFRDAACATKACYQAVIEAPITFHLDGASFDRLDETAFSLKLGSLASDPVADELGLDPDKPAPIQRAFHTNFGFDIQLGVEAWRAPT